MRLIPLATAWRHASHPDDRAAFRRHHAAELEVLRRLRTPTEVEFPLDTESEPGREDPDDPALHAALRAVVERMGAAGFRAPATVVMVSRGSPGAVVDVVPDAEQAMVVLAAPVDHCAGLAAGIAMLHRWHQVGGRWWRERPWDRWEVARSVPLAEWIYAAGLGVHAAQEFADATAAAAVQVTAGGFTRVRSSERALQERLDADLDQRGVGLLLRWLDDEGPTSTRRAADGFAIPAGAGRYLGWRMLEERVDRVGLIEAAGMAA